MKRAARASKAEVPASRLPVVVVGLCLALTVSLYVAARQMAGKNLKLKFRNGAEVRPQYAPVCYVEPEADNEPASGYDLRTDSAARAALEKACDSAQLVVTTPLTLLHAPRGRRLFQAYQPIFRGGGIPATVEERRARIRGYVTGLYRVEELVEVALRNAHQTDLSLHLFDAQSPPAERDLYGQPPPVAEYSQEAMVDRTLEVGQRAWRLSLYPSLAFLQTRRDWTPEWLLAAGLLVTLVVGTHLFHLQRGAAQVAELVARRTGELTATNAQLQRTLVACQRAEEAIKQSLQEKEILLKEIHHRVKNNLQIVSSFLSLRADQIQDEASRSALRDTQDRVHAMALLHESLYRSGDLAHADFPAYVEGLCTQMSQSYGVVASRIQIVQNIAPVALDLDQAVTLGLLISELFSNALKHAFPDERAGRITVEIQTTLPDGVVLTVADDGVGLPPEFAVAQSQSLGLRLVERLARKLGGTVTLEGGLGTTARVEFSTPTPPEEE